VLTVHYILWGNAFLRKFVCNKYAVNPAMTVLILPVSRIKPGKENTVPLRVIDFKILGHLYRAGAGRFEKSD
jgi:hypothetical protein